MKTLKITLLLAVICLFFVSLAPKNNTVELKDSYEVENAQYDVIAHQRTKGDKPTNS
jgi:hypothetical protein